MNPKKKNSYTVRWANIGMMKAMSEVPSMPNNNCPVVVRVAKRSEIKDIPSDRFSVTVIASLESPHKISDVDNGEEKLLVAIRTTKMLERQLKSFRLGYRGQIRHGGGNGGGELPPCHIFMAPINEDKLSDCIVQVMDDFFHDEKTCTICNMKITRMEFCVLMHIFFKNIGILKNKSRLPYSTYLQNKVFGGKSEFGVRSYNNYANDDRYQKLDKELEGKKIDFKKHPKLPPLSNENILFPAFQEIGWAFQHSDYFRELREIRKSMEDFNL